MSAASSYWQTTKNVIWLSLGLGCVIGSFIFWVLKLAPKTVEIVEQQQPQEVARPIQSEKVTISDSLGAFNKIVAPLDLSKRSIKLETPDREFRGAKYVQDNQKKWTLQLIKVYQEDIIKAYLGKRTDRQQFNYIRLQDDKNPDYYVLIYGVYDTEQQALENAQRVNFNLPTSIQISAEQFITYLPYVNDMGADELMTSSKLREVKLSKTYTPPPAPMVKAQPPAVSAEPNTPVPQNNAISAEQNQSGNQQKTTITVQKPLIDEPKKDATHKTRNNEAQIADPF